MARRRFTIKRLDPWTVLKFGAVANIVFYAIFLLVSMVIWFIVDRLQLVDQICEIALDVGFASCGVVAGDVFQVLALLGGMGVIVQTALLVFFAFLYNLIADLTGGLVIGVVEEGAVERSVAGRPVTADRPPNAHPTDDPRASQGYAPGAQATSGQRPAPQADSGESLFEGR